MGEASRYFKDQHDSEFLRYRRTLATGSPVTGENRKGLWQETSFGNAFPSSYHPAAIRSNCGKDLEPSHSWPSRPASEWKQHSNFLSSWRAEHAIALARTWDESTVLPGQLARRCQGHCALPHRGHCRDSSQDDSSCTAAWSIHSCRLVP